MSDVDSKEAFEHGEDADSRLSSFLDEADQVIEGHDDDYDPRPPDHRRLELRVSDDRLEARLRVVFPDTQLAEVRALLETNGFAGASITRRSKSRCAKPAAREGTGRMSSWRKGNGLSMCGGER